MALTLDDVLNAPSDPNALNAHLLDRGLIPPPTPPPTAIAPVAPPAAPTGAPLPMTPPKITSSTDWMAREVANAGRPSSTVNAASMDLGAAPDVGAVKTMTPPSMTGVAPLNLEPRPGVGPQPAAPAATPGGIQPMTPPSATKGARPELTGEPGSPEWERSKIAQYEWDKANPWGSALNHPGVLGKLAHAASLIGQLGASAVVPGLVAEIPGTMANRNLGENEALRNLAGAEMRATAKEQADTQAKNVASEIAGRDVTAEEARQKLARGQTEQTLHTDTQGNINGWQDAAGKFHALDEEGTPEAIKKIAEATKSKMDKPQAEKMDNGDVVAIMPGQNGAPPTAQVVYHGDPKLETDVVQKTLGGQEHHVLVNKKTGEELKDLGAFKTEVSPAQALTRMKSDEEMVLGYDKDNKAHLMSRADAAAENLQHISKAEGGALEKAATHQTVLNTLQTQLNNVVDASGALDQNVVQRTIIAQALAHPSDTTADSLIRATVMSGASEKTKDYVQAVIALREAGLALPKEITGGSRVSEVQASALWASMPSAASLDSRYAVRQAKKFQSDIDRLRQRAPVVRGIDVVEPGDKIAGATKNEKTAGGGGVAAKAPEGKTSVYDPQGVQHFVNSDKLEQFLKDPKYKGWTKNAS